MFTISEIRTLSPIHNRLRNECTLQEENPPSISDSLTRPIFFAPLLLLCAATLSVISADRVQPISDEGGLLVAAVKILNGGVFYQDINNYAFPGVSYLLAGAMAIFGEHLSVARGLAGAFYCATVLGVYACAIALFDRRRAALCGACLLSLKFFAFPIYTMFHYSDASVATAILALALFLRHRFEGASFRLLLVGILTGFSVVTKQSTGILVTIVFILVLCFPAFAHGPRGLRRRIQEVSVFTLGLSLVLGSFSLYFASHGVFGAMIQSALLRPFLGYFPSSAISFLPPLAWWNFGDLRAEALIYYPQAFLKLALHETLPGQPLRTFYFSLGEGFARTAYSVIPVAYAWCTWSWIRAFRRSTEHEERSQESAFALGRFYTAAGVTLGIVASAFPRSDFIHVISIYPAVVLIAFALSRPTLLGLARIDSESVEFKIQTRRRRVEFVAVGLLLFSTAFLAFRYNAILTQRITLDRAELWVDPSDAWVEPLINYLQKNIAEDETLFVYGHEAHFYFLADRYSSHPFPHLYPGMTGDETGEMLATLIRETRPKIIVQGILTWPGTYPLPQITRVLRQTIRQLYVLDPSAIPHPPNARTLQIWRLRE